MLHDDIVPNANHLKINLLPAQFLMAILQQLQPQEFLFLMMIKVDKRPVHYHLYPVQSLSILLHRLFLCSKYFIKNLSGERFSGKSFHFLSSCKTIIVALL